MPIRPTAQTVVREVAQAKKASIVSFGAGLPSIIAPLNAVNCLPTNWFEDIKATTGLSPLKSTDNPVLYFYIWDIAVRFTKKFVCYGDLFSQGKISEEQMMIAYNAGFKTFQSTVIRAIRKELGNHYGYNN